MKTMVRNGMFLIASAFCTEALASPGTLNYQGRILKSDGTALEYNNVSFAFEFTNETGTCVFYREQRNNVNMQGSKGIFDIPIGEGTKLYPTTPSYSLRDVFNNSVQHTCEGATTYTPAYDEVRVLRVQFHDGTGWKAVTPNTTIRSVPFAGFSYSSSRLGDKLPTDFVLKTAVTTCTAGQYLTFDGTNFTCQNDAGGAGMVSDINVTAPMTKGGTASIPVLGISVGTTAGTVAAGNDARFTDSRPPSGTAGGDLSGSYPNPSVAKIQSVAVSSTAPTSGHFFKYDGSQWLNSAIAISDVTNLSTTLGTYQTTAAFNTAVGSGNCASHQTPYWNSVSGSFQCQAINVSLAGDVSGAIGSVTVNKIKGVNVDTTGLTSGQVLKYDGTKWAPASDSNAGGTVTNVTGTAPIVVATGSTTPAISIDNATTSTKGAVQVGAGIAVSSGTISADPANFPSAVPMSKGGTGATSITANRLIASNGTGSALIPFTCAAGYVITFDATGMMICSPFPDAFVNGGNIFGTTTTLGTNDAQNLGFKTNGVVRATLKTDGNFGIGNSNPSYPLDITGTSTAARFTSSYNAGTRVMIANTDTGGKSWNLISTGSASSGGVGALVLADFSTSASGQFSFESDGKFGVGTLVPAAALHVSAPSAIARISASGLNENASLQINNELENNGYSLTREDSVNGLQFNYEAPIGTTSKLLMTMLSTGYVGIGVTNPTLNLSLDGNSNKIVGTERQTSTSPGKNLTLQVGGVISGGNNYPGGDLILKSGIATGSGSSGISFFTSTAGASGATDNIPTQKMTITGAGDVGIGTASPAAPLHVAGNIKVGLVNPANTGTLPGYGNYLYFHGGPSPATSDSDVTDPMWMARYNLAADQSELRVNITDNNQAQDSFSVGYTSAGTFNTLMRVQGDGKVGIGDTSPSYKLDVNGEVAGRNGLGYVLYVGGDSSGDLEIGTTQTTNNNLVFYNRGGGHGMDIQARNITYSGSLNPSDRRLKKEIQPLHFSLEKILKVEGVSYYWKEPQKYSEGLQRGVIAQQVEEIYPDLVKTDKLGMKKVNYLGLISPMIESIKEFYTLWFNDSQKIHKEMDVQRNQILVLEEQNKELQKRNKDLEERLQIIEKHLRKPASID
ncbi:tail fiber domain-containing protein [Bdellovibrio sp. HCB-110]|uniref:tail fiber domain-containing protein n=1 Tax=Bdellovibrio sp. HCB-110 TaxID=3391182 RepID=UPI0039B4F47F